MITYSSSLLLREDTAELTKEEKVSRTNEGKVDAHGEAIILWTFDLCTLIPKISNNANKKHYSSLRTLFSIGGVIKLFDGELLN